MTTKQIMRWVLIAVATFLVSLVMVLASVSGQWTLALAGSALAIVVGLLRAGFNLTSERSAGSVRQA